jgi:hypothetical protein
VPASRITSKDRPLWLTLPAWRTAAALPRSRLVSDLHPDEEVRSQQELREGRMHRTGTAWEHSPRGRCRPRESTNTARLGGHEDLGANESDKLTGWVRGISGMVWLAGRAGRGKLAGADWFGWAGWVTGWLVGWAALGLGCRMRFYTPAIGSPGQPSQPTTHAPTSISLTSNQPPTRPPPSPSHPTNQPRVHLPPPSPSHLTPAYMHAGPSFLLFSFSVIILHMRFQFRNNFHHNIHDIFMHNLRSIVNIFFEFFEFKILYDHRCPDGRFVWPELHVCIT